MGKIFRETLAEQMKDPEFKKVWDENATERERLRVQIKSNEFTLLPNQKQEGEEKSMSCHDIGHALNYVQEEIIEQYEKGKLDKVTAKALLIRAREAIGFCDGNVGEATASLDKHYCSDCMRKVDEGEDLFALYIGYPWYQQIDEYLAEHDMVGTVLCEKCFETMLKTMGMTSEEIEALKEEQRQERAN